MDFLPDQRRIAPMQFQSRRKHDPFRMPLKSRIAISELALGSRQLIAHGFCGVKNHYGVHYVFHLMAKASCVAAHRSSDRAGYADRPRKSSKSRMRRPCRSACHHHTRRRNQPLPLYANLASYHTDREALKSAVCDKRVGSGAHDKKWHVLVVCKSQSLFKFARILYFSKKSRGTSDLIDREGG